MNFILRIELDQISKKTLNKTITLESSTFEHEEQSEFLQPFQNSMQHFEAMLPLDIIGLFSNSPNFSEDLIIC